jgi:anti-sigma B factor antagonist
MTVQMRAIDHGVAISGELDLASVGEFRQFASSVVDGEHEVVLDIAELEFIDTTGISAILGFAEADCPNGLVLRSPKDNVQRVLLNLGIEQIAGIKVVSR